MNAITQLSDKALITETLGLRGKEKEILHQLLILFGEIDSRKLYRDEGYPSLFVYLHEGLGYSKSGAYRRVEGSRLLRDRPELFEELETGKLSFSSLVELSKVKDSEKLDSLLEESKGRSQRAVSELVEREQAPTVRTRRDRIRTVKCIAPRNAAPLLMQSNDSRSSNAELQVEEVRFEVSFQADEDFMKLYREAKALVDGSSMKDVFGKVLKDYLKRNSPKEKQKRRSASAKATADKKSRKARITKDSSSKRTRHIPALVRDEVFLRDNGQCTFVSDTGNRCCATKRLEIDHILPFARGGSHDLENLRLLCREHNQLEAEKVFGRDNIERYHQQRYRREGSPPERA